MPRGRSYYKTKRRKRAARAIQRAWKNRTRKVKRPSNYRLYIGVKTKVLCLPLRQIEAYTMDASFKAVSLEFKLSNFQLYTAWSNLFELYRIIKIKQVIYPNTSMGNHPIINYDATSTPEGKQLNVVSHPLLLTRVERDGEGSNPTNIEDCLKNPSFKVRSLNRTQVIKYTPNILDQVYETSLQTGYAPKFKQWISTDDTDVLHFGIKRCMSVKNASSVYPVSYRIITTAYVEFKNLRYEENN